MTKRAAFLDDRGVVRVGGEDAARFLQGLLTNDVVTLGAARGALCGAAVAARQDPVRFPCRARARRRRRGVPHSIARPRRRAISPSGSPCTSCAPRSPIADESADHGVIAYWSDEPENAPGGVFYADPRAGALGHRAILPRAKAVAVGEASVGEYEALRISLGVPKGGVDFAYGEAFPHDADMDLFHGLDFEKGCYVGQEVVSRMKHRGEARKRVVRVRLTARRRRRARRSGTATFPSASLGSSSGAPRAGAVAARPRRGRQGGGAELEGRRRRRGRGGRRARRRHRRTSAGLPVAAREPPCHNQPASVADRAGRHGLPRCGYSRAVP